jgi:hypothetical protein
VSDIKIGDLVMVIKSHCPHPALCVVFIVESLGKAQGKCSGCRNDLGVHSYACGQGYYAPYSWLKRIDPSALPESIKCGKGIMA